jgi:hypothetical protein
LFAQLAEHDLEPLARECAQVLGQRAFVVADRTAVTIDVQREYGAPQHADGFEDARDFARLFDGVGERSVARREDLCGARERTLQHVVDRHDEVFDGDGSLRTFETTQTLALDPEQRTAPRELGRTAQQRVRDGVAIGGEGELAAWEVETLA